MLGVFCKSSAIWAALATKTAFGAPRIALHPVTSSPSGIPYRHQEHRDALSSRCVPPIAQSHFSRTGQSSFQGSEIEPGQPNGVGKTGRSERNAPPCWSILEE
jgi:hypothetical protein